MVECEGKILNRVEHLLTCLTEECAEIQQAVAKALRFGLNDGHPGRMTSNAGDIMIEYADLVAVFELLQEEGVIGQIDTLRETIDQKKIKVKRYMEYAKSRGTLSGD